MLLHEQIEEIKQELWLIAEALAKPFLDRLLKLKQRIDKI